MDKDLAISLNLEEYEGFKGLYYDDNHIIDEDHYSQRSICKTLIYLFSHLELMRGESLKVIDVGCGTGNLSLKYYKYCKKAKVYNLDLSSQMLNLLGMKLSEDDKKRSVFINKDALSFLENDKSSFDLVGFSGSLHHIYDYKDVLKGFVSRMEENQVLFINLEPRRCDYNYFENTLRIIDYALKDFNKGWFKSIIMILYSPFHIIKKFIIKKEMVLNAEIHNHISSEFIIDLLMKNKFGSIRIRYGEDYYNKTIFKICNFFGLNKHFKLVAIK